jgi:DNA-binding MarR family transcriptional regulator
MSLTSKLGALSILLSDVGERVADDLSPSAAALLLTLRFRSALTTTELADIAGIAQPTAVRVLDGLVGRGLVVRQKRTGRQAPVRLSSLGRTRARQFLSARLRALGYVLRALSSGERAALEGIIDKLLAEATTSRAFARTTCRLCDHATCDGPRCPIGSRATELERAAGLSSRGGEPC